MGRRDRNNGITNIRASSRCAGGGEYRMLSADGGRKCFWASSDYTGALKKTTQMAGRSSGGVNKLRQV